MHRTEIGEMLCLDFFCGKGGWATGFLAAGYRVIGIDIVPQPQYPGEFIQQDARTVDGRRWRGFVDVIVASPPCLEFTRHMLPWTKKRNPPQPSLELVQTTYRLRDEIQPRFFILENVREAQRWLGKATIHRGPYYLWGDVFLLSKMSFPKKESLSSTQAAERSRIPFQLAYQVALLCKSALEV